jgi:hypothetical protein
VRNKLSSGDNNILINFLFAGKVWCELQLSTHDMKKKDKSYYTFCHFLYELERGKFGVITECATIIAQHDPITKSCEKTYIPKSYYKAKQ